MKYRTLRRTGSGPLFCAALLAGCSSITGLDGSSQYACKAPEGVKCASVSGNYYNAIQNNLPSQRKPVGSANPVNLPDPQGEPAVNVASRTVAAPTATAIASEAVSGGSGGGATYLAAPLRAGPRVLRLWIKPWEDTDRDLNGESLVYVQVDNGRWLVDHVQRQAREPYAPVRPTRLPTSAGKGSAPGARETDPHPAQPQGQSKTDEEPSIMRPLRALQGRTSVAPGN